MVTGSFSSCPVGDDLKQAVHTVKNTDVSHLVHQIISTVSSQLRWVNVKQLSCLWGNCWHNSVK